MEFNDEDIDTLLEKWYTAKQDISLLEKKCEKYKKYAEKIMDCNRTDEITNDIYSLTRREMSRTILAKEDVPRDIWHKYSKSICYPMYVIKEKGKPRKLKKSV